MGASYPLPALHRLEKRGLLQSTWDRSDANRRAKFYTLTARGRTQLKTEAAAWTRLAGAIEKVMTSARAGDPPRRTIGI